MTKPNYDVTCFDKVRSYIDLAVSHRVMIKITENYKTSLEFAKNNRFENLTSINFEKLVNASKKDDSAIVLGKI